MLWADPKEITDEKIATWNRAAPIDADIACHMLTRSAGLPALKGFVVSLTPKRVPSNPSSTVIGASESLRRGFGVAFSGFQNRRLATRTSFP